MSEKKSDDKKDSIVKQLVFALLIPAMLAFVGYEINLTLQNKEDSLQKGNVVISIINEEYSGDYSKALAMDNLFKKIDSDMWSKNAPVFQNYMKKLASDSASKGNYGAVYGIQQACLTIGGSSAKRIYQLVDSIGNYSAARKNALMYDSIGYTYLKQKNFGLADSAFKTANQYMPGIHSAYEISNYLGTKKRYWANKRDTGAQNQILNTIDRRYSWGAPKHLMK